MSNIYAEVMMVVIVILMSSIIFIWGVPALQSTTTTDNAQAAYNEKFQTLAGAYATFVQSTPETVRTAPNPPGTYQTCTLLLPVILPTTNNIYVPPNAVCNITTSVGNVYVDYGASLTMIGATTNRDIDANFSASITIQNSNVKGFIGLFNVGAVNISNSQINSSGIGRCTDNCGAAMYAGGRGSFIMTGNTVTGQIENEVGHQTYFTNNHIAGRLEVESADFGQIINNTGITLLDLDQNGVLVISGNTINGNALYGTNGWCGTGNNIITGTTNGNCSGNIEVDVMNTGSIPTTLVAIYLDYIPLTGGLSWQLASGNPVQCGSMQTTVCTQLPIIVPVGQIAKVTMGWTPPPGGYALPWEYIHFIMVSRHSNFVDGDLYFSGGLLLPGHSRLENRVCPPCY